MSYEKVPDAEVYDRLDDVKIIYDIAEFTQTAEVASWSHIRQGDMGMFRAWSAESKTRSVCDEIVWDEEAVWFSRSIGNPTSVVSSQENMYRHREPVEALRERNRLDCRVEPLRVSKRGFHPPVEAREDGYHIVMDEENTGELLQRIEDTVLQS